MKKKLTFLVWMSLCLSTSFAQTAYPDSTITYSPNKEKISKAMYEYNEQYFVISQTYENWSEENNIWIKSNREIYEYNEQNLVISQTYENWNEGNNAWIKSNREIYEYDSNGNRTLELYETGYGNEWVSDYRIISEYNTNGNILNSESQTWNLISKKWDNGEKEAWKYDTNGNATSEEKSRWDSDSKKWETDIRKHTNSYNSKKQLTQVISEWNDGTETRKGKSVYVYDSYGYKIDEEVYYLVTERDVRSFPNLQAGQWVGIIGERWSGGITFRFFASKTTWLRDEDGRILKETTYPWDVDTQKWRTDIPRFEDIYEYDENGNQISFKYYSNDWLTTGVNKVEGNTFNEYAYDANNNRTSQTDYRWNASLNDWELYSKYVYFINEEGNISVSQSYRWNGTQWILWSYTIYYPNERTSDLVLEETQQVESDNVGKMNLSFPLPENSIVSGSFVIQFPEGITLDIDETILSDELVEFVNLEITALENNSWEIKLKSQEIRSDKEIGSYLKIMDIAYIVDEKLSKGGYSASVQNLGFETTEGLRIIEGFREFEIRLERWAVGINVVESDSLVRLHIQDGRLLIKTEKAEHLDIYSVSGIKLLSSSILPGRSNLNISHLPKGALIVRGSSGWIEKIINK